MQSQRVLGKIKFYLGAQSLKPRHSRQIRKWLPELSFFLDGVPLCLFAIRIQKHKATFSSIVSFPFPETFGYLSSRASIAVVLPMGLKDLLPNTLAGHAFKNDKTTEVVSFYQCFFFQFIWLERNNRQPQTDPKNLSACLLFG